MGGVLTTDDGVLLMGVWLRSNPKNPMVSWHQQPSMFCAGEEV